MHRAASLRLVDECSRAAGKNLDTDGVREYPARVVENAACGVNGSMPASGDRCMEP
jgi:hypothetical protein